MNDIEFRDLGDSFDAALLEQCYREVYLPAFPVRDEQEDPSIWTPRLRDPQANPRLWFLVAGRALADAGRRTLLGLLVAEHYAHSGCVLVSYAAVHGPARRQGLTTRLFGELRRRLEARRAVAGTPAVVRAVFAEIHDPAQQADGDDVLDPRARVRVMARLGGWRIPIRYVQPALGPQQAPARGLWLIVFPALAANGSAPRVDDLRAFLVEFYRELGSPDPRTDPVYTETFADVDALGHGLVPLEPLDDACPAA